ncbi:hypothetical protein AKJ09_02295 [Labilithrix luteola]|uniref:Type IV fimbrial biogenesis protein PilY1 n=1 Tax=Labilithrix luteola TaxID=1391654 RepID=A0A0K1PQG4_9BACT|nr:hypothetical protein [Labilithrix luteola]AKU95631.1 hypothetical protein AKJ09_02295 [Labilithrix luteola]
MRATILFCGASLALGAMASVAACATSENEPQTTSTPDSGETIATPSEGGQPEAATDSGTEAASPECSDAGWCRTSLPDDDLTLKDIWPVGETAFAIADSPTLGIKVLEWKKGDASWSYIDDSSQNDVGLGKYAGRIWAPSENEIYYGVGPGYVYYGKRPEAPNTTWSWTRESLKDNSHPDFVDPQDGYPLYPELGQNYPTLGIWGTSAGDVYAWFTNTIYRRTSTGGAAPEWVPEYVADDASDSTEHMYFLSAAGAGPDDVWFSATRARSGAACTVLVRKTGGAYRRVADGIASDWSDCEARQDQLLIGGAPGWLTDLHMPSPNEIVGLKGGRDVVHVSISGDGYSLSAASVSPKLTGQPLDSLWAIPGSVWLCGSGVVLQGGNDVWDGGTFQISTLAMNGGALKQTLYQVRGTSNTNLWAIGVRNALHKTTP